MLAWGWAASEMRTHGGDANWAHADSLDTFADILPNAFTLTGNCRFPLYITGGISQEWSDSWKLFDEQRVARHGLFFRGSSAEAANAQTSISSFRSVAQRNHSRARRRCLRARSFSSHPGCDAMKIFLRRRLAFTLTRRSTCRVPLQA